jgi:hypothetical protein
MTFTGWQQRYGEQLRWSILGVMLPKPIVTED